MLGQTAYKTMVSNVVEKALLKGARLKNYKLLSYGAKDDRGNTFYHALRVVHTDKQGNDECRTEYEGNDAKECAAAIITICGMFDSMSVAMKWHQQHPDA